MYLCHAFVSFFLFFFCFKQKTAYDMRISDWSSDVCSSDLYGGGRPVAGKGLCPAKRRVIARLRQSFLEAASLHQRRALREAVGEKLPVVRHVQRMAGLGHGQEDRKSTRLNSSHSCASRMPSYACKNKTQQHTNHIQLT